MRHFAVVFAPEAQDNLIELYAYIADKASPMVAERYTDALVATCESLSKFPHRGTQRDDVRPGLRITNHRRRAVIAFEVDDETAVVSILGIFYGGRDYEGTLGEPDLSDSERS